METVEKVRELNEVLEDLRFAMVGTSDGGTWKSRPLALAEEKDGTLRFLVSHDADWVQALDANGSPTTVTFSDPGKNSFVSLQGRARTLDDRALIRHLWNPGAAAYVDGKDDPTVRVLEVDVEYGEWWDGPSGRIGQLITVAGAAMGKQVGDQGPVAP